MHDFTQELVALLATKEWLPQTDAASATPYFVKCAKANNQVVFLTTDTKAVWTEVLPSRSLTRRWWKQNSYDEVDAITGASISEISDLTMTAHSLSGWSTCFAFQPVESMYSEKAFVLKFRLADTNYQWTWETNYVGARLSAEIISKQLLLPLLSTAHMGFSSSLSNASPLETQQLVDKLGRVIKRSLDIHVKNAMSNPRLATVIQRLSTNLSHSSDLPPVSDEIEAPQFKLPRKSHTTPSPPSAGVRAESPVRSAREDIKEVPVLSETSSSPQIPQEQVSIQVTSATESESDSPPTRRPLRRYVERPASLFNANSAPIAEGASEAPLPAMDTKSPTRSSNSGDDSDTKESSSRSPPRKKLVRRKPSSGDGDENGEHGASPVPPPRKALKRRTEQSSSDSESLAAASPVKRATAVRGSGTRQPIRRGGKKF